MKRSYALVVAGTTLLLALGYFLASGTTANETPSAVANKEKKLSLEETAQVKTAPRQLSSVEKPAQEKAVPPSTPKVLPDSKSEMSKKQNATFHLSLIPKQGLPKEHNATEKTAMEFHIFDRRVSDGKEQKIALEVPQYVIENSDMFELVVTEPSEGKSLKGELSFLSAVRRGYRYVIGIEYYDTVFYAEILEEQWDERSKRTLDELESLVPLKAPQLKLKDLPVANE